MALTMSALYTVILNVVKNLSESADVRLLCYPVDASLSLSMTYSANEIATSGIALLAMTMTGGDCHSLFQASQ